MAISPIWVIYHLPWEPRVSSHPGSVAKAQERSRERKQFASFMKLAAVLSARSQFARKLRGLGIYGCCWETCCIVAYCGLAVEIQPLNC